jgi:hypothetical protein
MNDLQHILRSDEGEAIVNDDPKTSDGDFFPRGAIAFFAAMVAAYGLIWLAIYFLLLHRQLGL